MALVWWKIGTKGSAPLEQVENVAQRVVCDRVLRETKGTPFAAFLSVQRWSKPADREVKTS